MQTYVQTFAGSQTWTLNVPGKYFTTLQCTNPINVRFYLGGKQLDLGQISQLLAGLEVTLGEINDPGAAFDRVELDITGPDTVAVGIGNGQARYNRSQGSVQVVGTVPVDLIQADIDQIIRPVLPGAQSSQNALLTANTAVNIFTAASNVNGALVWSAAAGDQHSTVGQLVLIAKATAPANIVDGEIIETSEIAPLSTTNYVQLKLQRPARIAPGLGLWWIASSASAVAGSVVRSCRFTLL